MDDQLNNISERLARFVHDSRWSDIPEEVRHEARRSLVNYFATALAGCRESPIEIAARVLVPFSGAPVATIIGRPEKVDAPTAAFLNAASANVFDFDDTHIPTVIHPTAPVAAAAFALAEMRPVSGAELLHAFVLGVEIECRLGNAMHPAHYRKGWHVTSTCGVFGAAVAAAKLIGLDWQRIVWAFGAASTQSSGLVETLGTMAKSNGVGGAARAGLLAALLAEQGFVGPERPLEGARGFFAVMSEAVKGEALSENLGATWEIQRNSYKPYPCGVVLNSVIDACLEIKKRKPVDLAQIAEITISAHPLLRERTDRPHVETGRLSQVSAQHAAAVVFVKGAAGLPQFSDEAVHDPAVRRLRAKVLVAEVQAIPVGAAHVEVVFGSGETIAITVEHARGSLERPLSDQELEQKLITLSAFGCPQLKSSLLIDAVWSLDQTTDGSAVLKYAIPLENAELLGRSAGLTDI